MSDKIKHISDSSFDKDVVKSGVPVLLDFGAEWSGPSKVIAPILDEIATNYEGKLIVAKIDIDNNPATPAKFGVRVIPTLILFKNGAVAAQKALALSRHQIYEFLDSHL